MFLNDIIILPRGYVFLIAELEPGKNCYPNFLKNVFSISCAFMHFNFTNFSLCKGLNRKETSNMTKKR